MHRSFKALLLSIVVIPALTSCSKDPSIEQIYRMPEGVEVNIYGTVLKVTSFTEFKGATLGTPLSQIGDVDGVDLSTLKTFLNPESRQAWNASQIGQDLRPDLSDEDFLDLIRSESYEDLRLLSMCQFLHEDTHHTMIPWVTFNDQGKYSMGFIYNLEEHDGKWKFAAVMDWMVSRWTEALMLARTDALAYFVSGEERILERKGVGAKEIQQMTDLRAGMIDDDNRLDFGKLMEVINAASDEYRHQDIRHLLVIEPSEEHMPARERLVLDDETIQQIRSDLADIDPALRELIIEKIQSHGAMRAVMLLSGYTDMQSPDALDLVGTWTSIDHIQRYDSLEDSRNQKPQ